MKTLVTIKYHGLPDVHHFGVNHMRISSFITELKIIPDFMEATKEIFPEAQLLGYQAIWDEHAEYLLDNDMAQESPK